MRRTPDQIIAPIHWLAAAGLATIAHLGVIAPGGESIELTHAEESGVALDLSVLPQQEQTAETRAPTPIAKRVVPEPADTRSPPASAGVRSSGRATSPASSSASATAARATSAPSVGVADYFTELQQWLTQFRDYPDSARRRGWEGVVELAFTVEPDGRVHGARIVRSSGFPILDNAAFEMLARAAPLPPIPAELSDQGLAITVPVGYQLRVGANQ